MSVRVLNRQTLGSFLVRWAWEQGETPAALTRRLGLGWSIWTRDLDRSVGADASEQIGRGLGLDHTVVEAMTLSSLLNSAGVQAMRNGFQRWVTPIGIFHRRRLRFGQMYCPACFQEGVCGLPLLWRVASSWICTHHEILLCDCCSECGSPFAPYRRDALMMRRCDQCVAPLTRVRAQHAPPWEVELHRAMVEVWEASQARRGVDLVAAHAQITRAARSEDEFRCAGEPWTYWRVDERRALMINVLEKGLFAQPSDHWHEVNDRLDLAPGRRDVCRSYKRRRTVLPKDPAQRAEQLLTMASKIRYPRRPMARVVRLQ